MPFYAGQGGNWRQSHISVGRGGQWRQVLEAWAGQGGQWRRVYLRNPVTGVSAIEDFARCPLTTEWLVTVNHHDSATIVLERRVGQGVWDEMDRRTVSGSGSYTFKEVAVTGPGAPPDYWYRAYATEYGPSTAFVSGPHAAVGCGSSALVVPPEDEEGGE